MQADEYIYLLIPTFFKVSTRAITQRSTFSPSLSSSNHYRFSAHPLNESIILSFIEKEEKVTHPSCVHVVWEQKEKKVRERCGQ